MTGNHFEPTVMPAINEDHEVRGFKARKNDLDIYGLVAKVDLSIYNEILFTYMASKTMYCVLLKSRPLIGPRVSEPISLIGFVKISPKDTLADVS